MTERRKVVNYLVITFVITYTSWGILLVLTGQGLLGLKSPARTALHMLGGFGPTIAAISQLESKRPKHVLALVFSYKKGTTWYILLFSLLHSLSIGFSAQGLNPDLPSKFLIPGIMIGLASATLIGGGNEELGWRGILQPAIEERLAFPIATAITGLIWSVWHLPLWFIEGMGQAAIPFSLFAAYAIALSFYLASIYKKTKSLFFCMFFHGLSNTLFFVFVFGMNLVFALGMIGLLGLSIWTWHKTDRLEKQ